MTVQEVISLLEVPARIEFQDQGCNTICWCMSDSDGIRPYADAQVAALLPLNATSIILKLAEQQGEYQPT